VFQFCFLTGRAVTPTTLLQRDSTTTMIAEVITNLGTSREFLRSLDRQVVVQTDFMDLS
jgi:hypothetical protein